ncbi:hypothetical protein VTN96DRAFT_6626 [Rasamsonia emersonii]
MSSYHAQPQPYPQQPYPPRHAASYNPAAPMGSAAPPAGTFLPGTKVQVGSHRVVVEKYLSEGGFAHVYVVRLPQPVDGSDVAVLKRVAVPDKAALANMRTEVETMKKLKGHRHIVTYIDSHASQLKGGGYEVFLLMEYCAGGGLIDFMNTRLQNRLTEPEILTIFADVAEGVACMHYLKPPLLHRDLKVENVLISLSGSSPVYKLCDFGSAAPPRPAATSAAEGRLIEDDIQRHTTLQYRSPEMIDVYRKQPIDEKSDIWALGVLLYKLCYYTTPFEEVGQMAILNASYKFPAYPPFSDRLKRLIASMLMENPQKRPTIYEVLREACSMQGKEVPIHDIYSQRTQSETRSYQELPPSTTEAPKVGAIFSPPIQETQIIPDIAPMRRGRPSKPTSQQNSANPSPSPFRGGNSNSNDPFAALDGARPKLENTDELSARFPTLDQFSLLHEKNGKFEFEPTVTETKLDAAEDLSQRITNALADEAFVKRSSPSRIPSQEPTGNNHQQGSSSTEKRQNESLDQRGESARTQTPLHQPVPQKPKMVDAGTMTDPPPPGPEITSYSNRPIYRFPPPGHERRPSSQPWSVELERSHSGLGSGVPSQTTTIHKVEPKPKTSSEKISNAPTSSRPSLEVTRPALIDLDDAVSRPKSANSRARPASVFAGSKVDYAKEPDVRGSSFDQHRPQYEDGEPLRHMRTDGDRDLDRANITSDVDFLRAREEEEMNRKKEKRHSSGSKHVKRSSLSFLSGRFGDAFRRFEQNAQDKDAGSQPPSPDDANKPLTPIAGSEMTDTSDDGSGDNDPTDISPEMRRELERRRLSQEERRVANAAAEYRLRVAGKGVGGRDGTKSPVIQSKVQSLLQNSNQPPPPKTASGYGRYTDANPPLPARPSESQAEKEYAPPLPVRPKPPPKEIKVPSSGSEGLVRDQTATDASQRSVQRPAAPPKPKNLRPGGAAETPTNEAGPVSPTSDDWEANFSRRYPSLSGLELVETEIEVPKMSTIRTREV